MKKFFAARSYGKGMDCTMLLVRLVCGSAMAMHGWGKIQSPFGWMGPDAAVPGILQGLAALSEFGGGIALALGLVTRLASLGMGFTMLVAAGMHAFVMGDPFVASGPGQGSYELASIYLVISLFFISSGPGKHSLDNKLFGV